MLIFGRLSGGDGTASCLPFSATDHPGAGKMPSTLASMAARRSFPAPLRRHSRSRPSLRDSWRAPMANGTAVRVAPFTPELPAASAFAKAQADKPSAVSAGSQGIETTIGEAVAAAGTTICKAILDHRQTGMLDPEIKDASAARLARVAMLALDHEPGDEDFLRTARESAGVRCVGISPPTMTRPRPRRSTWPSTPCLKS